MRWFRDAPDDRVTLRDVLRSLHSLHGKVDQIMSTQGDLDAALTGLETQDAAETAAIATLTTTVAANSAVIKQLVAELAAAGSAPSPSLAAEIARVQALNTADTAATASIGTDTSQITADDATAPTPPASVPPTSTSAKPSF